jgi:hypothetical protein
VRCGRLNNAVTGIEEAMKAHNWKAITSVPLSDDQAARLYEGDFRALLEAARDAKGRTQVTLGCYDCEVEYSNAVGKLCMAHQSH